MGIGKQLLQEADRQIKSCGGKTVSIAIIAESAILRRWYENHGFVAGQSKTFDHLPFTVLFMKKTLF
ncbi:MAG: GNAT family N-acetyltransferase [Spirochaetales bacterium]|nr:GNAT family N-acetyltransferase [Spirochaetales bacterium]